MNYGHDAIDNYIVTEDRQLNYLEWGDKTSQPLVLLHELGDCARSWEFISESLSGKYRLIAIDGRGHGDSDFYKTYTPRNYVNDLELLLSKLEITDTVLVGHGLGASYGLLYASEHKKNIKALVLADMNPVINNSLLIPYLDRMNESNQARTLRQVIDVLKERQPNAPQKLIDHQVSSLTRKSANKFIWKLHAETLHWRESLNLWPIFQDLNVPTAIIRGRQSKFLEHDTAVIMREKILGSLLVELEGTGHWVYDDAPEAFATSIEWFLNYLKNSDYN